MISLGDHSRMTDPGLVCGLLVVTLFVHTGSDLAKTLSMEGKIFAAIRTEAGLDDVVSFFILRSRHLRQECGPQRDRSSHLTSSDCPRPREVLKTQDLNQQPASSPSPHPHSPCYSSQASSSSHPPRPPPPNHHPAHSHPNYPTPPPPSY